jgi:hypothetical protein
MDDISDATLGAEAPTASAPRIAGYRYPTPSGEPCPRTIRVDGTIEFNGNCQSCGTCLLYGRLVDLPVDHT